MIVLDDSWTLFRLGENRFGLHTSHVREIVVLQGEHALPIAPPHVRGMMDLRGANLTLYDLRRRFALPPAVSVGELREVVLVSEIGGRQLGFVVDEVLAIQHISRDEIEPAERVGAKFDGVIGFGKVTGDIVLLLDIQWVLGEQARRYPRIAVAQPVQLTVLRSSNAAVQPATRWSGVTEDVGAGGVGIATDLGLVAGDEVEISLALDPAAGASSYRCRLARVFVKGGRTTIGLVFADLTEVDRGRIASVVERLRPTRS